MSVSTICLVSFLLAVGPTVASVTPDAIWLEKQVLAARQAILRGEVDFQMVRMDPTGRKTKELNYKITFDGDRLRTDAVQPILMESGGQTAQTTGLHKYVFLPATILYHTDVVTPSGRRIALHWHDLNRRKEEGYDSYRIDPRVAGVVPADFAILHAFNLKSFLCRVDRKNNSVKKEVLENIETWHIKYNGGDAITTEFWIAPAQNYSIVRASTEAACEGKKLVDTIECENQPHGQGKQAIWYPRVVRYQRVNDGSLLYKALLTIKRAQFNEPIPEVVFTPAGMNIPKGTLVMEFPQSPGVHKIWDGEKIVPAKRKSSPIKTASSEPHGSLRLVLAAVSLMMMGLLSLVVYWRKRRRRS